MMKVMRCTNREKESTGDRLFGRPKTPKKVPRNEKDLNLFKEMKTKYDQKVQRKNNLSEQRENYLNYQKSWREKFTKQDIIPSNNNHLIADSRRTIHPNIQADTQFRPSVKISESHRNYSGNGNLADLINGNGTSDMEGFHRSNCSVRNSAKNESLQIKRDESLVPTNNLNSNIKSKVRANKSMDITRYQIEFGSPLKPPTNNLKSLGKKIDVDQSLNPKDQHLRDKKHRAATSCYIAPTSNSKDNRTLEDFLRNYKEREREDSSLSRPRRNNLNNDFICKLGEDNDNPITGNAKRLRADGIQPRMSIGINGKVYRDDVKDHRPRERSQASLSKQRELRGQNVNILDHGSLSKQRELRGQNVNILDQGNLLDNESYRGMAGITSPHNLKKMLLMTSPRQSAGGKREFDIKGLVSNRGKDVEMSRKLRGSLDIFKANGKKGALKNDRNRKPVMKVDPFRSYFEIK